jgi:hypothetical protein
MSCEGEGEGEGEGEEGKLPSVDHGRRTDRGCDKKKIIVPFAIVKLTCIHFSNLHFLQFALLTSSITQESMFRVHFTNSLPSPILRRKNALQLKI